jgi:hypothetical protein
MHYGIGFTVAHIRQMSVAMVTMSMSMSMPVPVPMGMFVSVVPEFSLVEQKEEHQAQQQSHEQGVWRQIAFKSLGQQV